MRKAALSAARRLLEAAPLDAGVAQLWLSIAAPMVLIDVSAVLLSYALCHMWQDSRWENASAACLHEFVQVSQMHLAGHRNERVWR